MTRGLPSLALASALFLSACNGVPLSTQWKLRSFDLSTADVAPLRVALRAPDWLEPTPTSARVVVTYWREDEETAKRVLTIRLVAAAHAEDRPILAGLDSATNGGLMVFEADRRDLAAIRAAQEEGKRWRESGAKAHGSLDLEGGLFCRRAELPSGPLLLDVYAHADDALGWLPLLLGHDAHAPGADEKKLAEFMPPCAPAPANIAAKTRR
ncbi:hypothetical protein EDE12_101736 [Methylosinus sp. sav-2]|uniref:hypothetical protein n=1 Tax=Methylosinus sp. sav-2 TaxID=2485168 RepID=UPI00068AF4E6|nr:hypothetical protein [Methylosinus sp. sav-2]TDX67194.1 hypothetical protein EDE12_101736 [Methylosinus sp. sav-2]